MSRPTYSTNLNAHRYIQLLPRCAGASQSNLGVVPLRPLEGQIWNWLNGSEPDPDLWVWSFDIYVDDSTTLFVIVAQAGKFYRVGLGVFEDEVALGEWLQMTQLFVPVAQSAHFVVRWQKNGKYRSQLLGNGWV